MQKNKQEVRQFVSLVKMVESYHVYPEISRFGDYLNEMMKTCMNLTDKPGFKILKYNL